MGIPKKVPLILGNPYLACTFSRPGSPPPARSEATASIGPGDAAFIESESASSTPLLTVKHSLLRRS